jgi:hypothetical protein
LENLLSETQAAMTKIVLAGSELRDRKERVSICCKKLGNRYQWAKASSVSQSTISNFEKGANVSCSIIQKLAKGAKVPAGWLLFGEGHSDSTNKPIILSPDHYASISKLDRTPSQNGENPLTVFRREDLATLVPGNNHGDLAALRISEPNLGPKFFEGDWVIVDRNKSAVRESGEYCIDAEGKIAIREIVFRDEMVVVAYPGLGEITSDLRSRPYEEFRKLVTVYGKVVFTIRPASSHGLLYQRTQRK